MKFETIYKSLLTETPYFEIGDDMYDLEIERFNTENGFVKLKQKIRAILSGKVLTDKYGNKIQLQGKEEKQDFEEKLKQDFTLNLFVQKRFNKTLKDLLDFH
jgi:hypothetical protein